MEPLDLRLPTLVTLAGPALTSLILDRVAQAGFAGVKPSHGYVIQRLVDDQPTIGRLAETLGMTQQGASKQVGDLESLGYVERVPDPGDQRIRTVRLTTAGRALLETARQIQEDLENELIERVGRTKVRTAKAVLAALLTITDVDEHIADRSVPLPRL